MRKNLSAAFIAITICAFTLNIQAQNFGLVKDINTSKDANPANDIYNRYMGWNNNTFWYAFPTYNRFAALNGIAYFAADDGVHGTELWRSNGAAGGTYMLKDIHPGSASSVIQSIVAVGNKIFFTVDNFVYVSDGTEAGTLPVPGITYPGGDATTCLTPVGNVLYFFTDVSRLWRTDGTAAGTSLIIDFRAIYNYSKDYLGQLTNVNGTLYFTTGQDDTNGAELWKSDGTAAGTMMVKDIYPGPNGSRPLNLTALKGKLYFSADDGTGVHLWVSDGTVKGTKPAVNNTGALLEQPESDSRVDISPLTSIENTLYFKAGTAATGFELYKYDITKPDAGIKLVKDILKGAGSSDPANLIAVDSTLYFSASGATGNQQLWKSNGLNSNTRLVKNMGAGLPKYFSNPINANGKLLFSFYTISKGYELWSSDGTANGTIMIKDIYAGNHSSMPACITYFKNGISLFSATDGINGIELWRTDGSESGTIMLKNINNITTGSSNSGFFNPVFLNGKLFFSAYTPAYGTNVYTSNGTAAGTQLLKDINFGNSSNPSNFTIFKDKVYFSADSMGFKSIYKTNGTAAGTIKIFSLGRPNATVRNIVAAQNHLYIFCNDADTRMIQLWATDGTASGFHKIQDLSPETGYAVGSVGDILYFQGYDSTHGSELWKATSTPGSAKLVKDIWPGLTNSYPNSFLAYKNKLYFQAYDSAYVPFIYMSDGTNQGTKRIFEGSGPIAEAQGKLFFSGYSTATGYELFISDGTTAGTALLKDIYKGINSGSPNSFTVMDNMVYFTAQTETSGAELWKSNGTKTGTLLVKDINPGINGSNPYDLTVANNQLYFWANNELYQRKLFVSNGKDAGTREVRDAGLDGITIYSFIGGGNKLFINGYTYASGNELYAGITPGFAPQINNAVADKLVPNEKFTASLLGNPVQDELRFSVNSVKEQHAQVVVTDVSGKVLVNKSEYLNKGSNNVSYSTNSWASGVYTLKIVGEDGSAILLKAVK